MTNGELFLQELKNRDIVQDITNEKKFINALNNKHKLYVGFDPSFKSLHLGNFVVLNILSLAKKYGVDYVAIVGGMTGLIGDPSGKKIERKLLDTNEVLNNVTCIKKQITNLLPDSIIANNADFYKHLSIIDFLREIGKYVNVSYLLNKEIIKNRLDTGISFTEFSYSLIQAYDFYKLHHEQNVDIELGGSDQWGNITIGIDFINKKDNIPENDSPLCGLTLKLLLKSDGTKFGKSEKGAVYLDAEITSPYTMYQFLLNQNDADALNLLNFLTDYDLAEIKDIINEHNNNPKLRYAQTKLAENLVTRIHGKEILIKVQNLSKQLFKGDLKTLSLQEINFILNDFPVLNYEFKDDESLIDILINAHVFKSKSEVRTLIKQNGLSIDGIKVTEVDAPISKEFILHNKFIIVKSGKQNIQIIVRN